MTVIRNERDKRLRLASIREFDPAFAQIVITPSATIFDVKPEGTTPAEITFTADLYGLTGIVTFSVVGASQMTQVGNVATLKAADTTADLIQVTATLQSNGKEHKTTRSVNRVAPLSMVNIIEGLEGQLTEDALTQSLRERIELIDADIERIGSVNARLKAETDARVAELDAAMNAAVAARDAFVKAYTYSKVEADQAEALQTFNITTAFTTYVDGQSGQVLSNAQAYVRGYSYSKTDADTALSTMANTLRTEMSTATNGTITAAFVENYAYSKSQIDSAEASQFNTLTANYRAYANGTRDDAVNVSTANFTNYAYSKAAADNAITAMASTLRSEFSNNGGASVAWVQQYAYSKTQANEAVANYTQTLFSRVGDAESAIQVQAETTNGLKNQYTVKIDNNGFVTGYGLASSYNNGVPTSAFTILADAFRVVMPGHAAINMFSVDGNGVGFSGPLKGPSGYLGTLTAARIQSAASGQRVVTTQLGTVMVDQFGNRKVLLGDDSLWG